MTCEQAHDLLEAYVLGALDEDEAVLVGHHLAECDACRAEASQLARAASSLPEALPEPIPPPGRLKAAVLAAIAARDAIAPESRQRPWRLSVLRPVRVPAAWVAVAVLVIGLTGAWAVLQTSALARESSLRAELAELVGQHETILELVDSSRTVKASLRATDGSTAYGKLYTRPDHSDVFALAGRLPAPPTGQVYNLWVTADGADVLAGPMPVNANGFGLILFDAGRTGPIFESARVILQDDGSDSPRGRVVLSWESGP